VIEIDGSYGEGGGQILRTSLGLSLLTGAPVHITNIRAGRKKTGLLRQHLTAVNAAVNIGEAECRGNSIGSQELYFNPSGIKTGTYRFSVGTAGSATLVLQTILPALLCAEGLSTITLEGGTHNPFAPPFDFLNKVFLNIINRMGPLVRPAIKQYGFYPAGGGSFTATITPSKKLRQIDLLHRGKMRSTHVTGIVSRLPLRIAQEEVTSILNGLDLGKECGTFQEVRSPGPGNVIMIEMVFDNITEMMTGFGQRGIPLRNIAESALEEAKRYLKHDVPVGEYLCDQLLIPFAAARGGSFRTLKPSLHTITNCHIIEKFLDIKVASKRRGDNEWEIKINYI
jgi:RNA 3'-terminal phosphate cyclase (ATP)